MVNTRILIAAVELGLRFYIPNNFQSDANAASLQIKLWMARKKYLVTEVTLSKEVTGILHW